MRKLFCLLISIFIFSGCLKSSSHLSINTDGSGTMESQLFMPRETIRMIDLMVNAMQQAMMSALGDGVDMKMPAPRSVAEEMFGEDEIRKKLAMSGPGAQIVRFDKQEREDGIFLDYAIKFDDINSLQYSDFANAIHFQKGENGDWFCQTIPQPDKAKRLEVQMDQFKKTDPSQGLQNMDPLAQKAMMKIVGNLELEYYISMPYQIKRVDDLFERVNATTARISFKGNFFEDESVLEKLYGLTSSESHIVWDHAQVANIEPIPLGAGRMVGRMEEAPKESPKSAAKKDGTYIFLKNGEAVQGELVERTEEYTKIKVHGIDITYYSDEIESVE